MLEMEQWVRLLTTRGLPLLIVRKLTTRPERNEKFENQAYAKNWLCSCFLAIKAWSV